MCPLSGQGGFSPRLIAGQDLEEEIQGRGVGVGRCLTCANCEERCPEKVRFIDFVRGLREMIPAEARRPCPHAAVFQAVGSSMAGPGKIERDLTWVGDGLEVAEEGEVALFVGCLPFFDIYFRKDLGVDTLGIARSAIRILNDAGIKPVLISGERCCGHDQLWSGDRKSFTALAEANTSAFAERGVKRIMTTCAECCRTWRIDYPEAVPGYQPRVEHMAEFLAERVKARQMRFKSNDEATLTYQDPCRLGRHLDVVDAPRQLLAALPNSRVVEMERAGRDAVCCGTSGFMHCDAMSRSMQTARLGEAAATGAGTLVTACPKCLIHFTCAQNEDRRRDGKEPWIKVEDLTVLAARLLAGEGDATPKVPARGGPEKGGAQ